MEAVIESIDMNNEGKKPYRRNPKYNALDSRIRRLSKKIDKTLDLLERKTLLKDLKGLKNLKRTMKSTIPNDGVFSLKYVRYADD